MRVPVYESRARTEALPTPQARPRPSGLEDVSRGLQQLGSAVGKIHEQAAQLQATEALNAFDEAAISRLYDPKNGLFHRKGSDAAAASGDAYDGLAKDQAEFAKGLTSDLARSIFLQNAQKRLSTYSRDIEKYVGGQINQARTAALETSEQRALDKIAQGAFADPEMFQQVMADVENRHQALSNSPEEYDARTVEWKRKATVTGLQSFLRSGDVQGAQAFLERYKPDMGAAGAELEQRLGKLVEDAKAESAATAVLRKHLDGADPTDPWVNLADLRAEALGATGKLKKKLDDKIASVKRAQDARVDEVFQRASGAMAAAEENIAGVDPNDLAWLKKRAGNKFHILVARDNARIAKAKAGAEGARAIQADIDKGAVADYRQLMQDDMDKALETDAQAFVGERGAKNAAREKILALQSSAKKARAAGEETKITEATDKFITRVTPSITGSDAKERIENLRNTFRDLAYELMDDKGKIPREKLDTLVAEQVGRVVVSKGWGPFSDDTGPMAEKIKKLSGATGLPPREVNRLQTGLVEQGMKIEDISAKDIERAQQAEEKLRAKGNAAGMDLEEAQFLSKLIATREGKAPETVTTRELEQERRRRMDAEVFDPKPASPAPQAAPARAGKPRATDRAAQLAVQFPNKSDAEIIQMLRDEGLEF